jgi:putative toxin-antitoxin system antitoxin component (TIGR02293 family)
MGRKCHIVTKSWQVAKKETDMTGLMSLLTTNAVSLAPAPRIRPDQLQELNSHGYSEAEIFDLVIPKRTLARRRAGNELLTVEETDKALRLKRIAVHAERVFGDPAKARRWLRKPKRHLQGETPLAFLASEEGARKVEEMLHRIDHGMAA